MIDRIKTSSALRRYFVGGTGWRAEWAAQTYVAPAQDGAHNVFPASPTGAMGPSLRWGDEERTQRFFDSLAPTG
jgi:hypothetical protein